MASTTQIPVHSCLMSHSSNHSSETASIGIRFETLGKGSARLLRLIRCVSFAMGEGYPGYYRKAGSIIISWGILEQSAPHVDHFQKPLPTCLPVSNSCVSTYRMGSLFLSAEGLKNIFVRHFRAILGHHRILGSNQRC
jgi:hypothetical protein